MFEKNLFFNTSFFVYYLSYSLVAKIFHKSLVDGAEADSMYLMFILYLTELTREPIMITSLQ